MTQPLGRRGPGHSCWLRVALVGCSKWGKVGTAAVWRAKGGRLVLVATVDNALKQKLEHLLGMSGGYVLNYTNASFEDFVRNSIGVNPL
jgi:hypothetical protein